MIGLVIGFIVGGLVGFVMAALLRLGCTVDDSGVVHWTSQTGG